MMRPAAVRVRQPGQDVRAAALADVRGVGVEDAFVVGLPVFREGQDDVRVGLVAVGLERAEHHAEAAVRHDRALERGLGLEADHDLVRPVDVARPVGGDRARHLRDVEDALLPLLYEQRLELRPDRLRAGGRRGEEGPVAVVRLVVVLDEVPDVYLLLPQATVGTRARASPPGRPSSPAVEVAIERSLLGRLRAGHDRAQQAPGVAGDHQLFVGRNHPGRRAAPALEIRGPLRGSRPRRGGCRATPMPHRCGGGPRRSSHRSRR